jgi:hypothetical protein
LRLAPAFLALTLAMPAAADPVVVELFTSQGCSSCPPADALLSDLSGREDVIALSLHVDYWDWIGWADTFAHPAHTARQKGYAAGMGSSVVYTPQFMVGGAAPIAGAHGMELAETIDLHQEAMGDVLRVASGADGREVLAMPLDEEVEARFILVSVLPEKTVRISHGENAGHALTYRNVVRGWHVLRPWDGTETRLAVPPVEDGLSRVVLAQVVGPEGPGRILGAVRVD